MAGQEIASPLKLRGLTMLTYDEIQDEIEFWKEEEWERKNGKDFFRTIVKVENGIEVEYHMAGDRCTVKCEKKTGKLVK